MKWKFAIQFALVQRETDRDFRHMQWSRLQGVYKEEDNLMISTPHVEKLRTGRREIEKKAEGHYCAAAASVNKCPQSVCWREGVCNSFRWGCRLGFHCRGNDGKDSSSGGLVTRSSSASSVGRGEKLRNKWPGGKLLGCPTLATMFIGIQKRPYRLCMVEKEEISDRQI